MRPFTLALLFFLAGCARPERIEAPPDARPHFGDAWFARRAEQLGLGTAEARARDEAIPEDRPPEGELDRPLRLEAAAIWSTSCAVCHGPTGEPPERSGARTPRTWGSLGTRMGFFFGGDRMRAGLYRTIREGGRPEDGRPSDMPSWSRLLSREQTWGLVRHLESF